MIKVPVCPVRFGDGEDEPPLPPRPKDTSPGCVSALSAVLIDNGPSAVAALSRSVHDEEEGKEGGEEVEGLCLEESQAEEEERDVGVLSEEGDYTENENLEGEFRRAEISFSEEEDESFAERHLDLEHTAAPPPSKRLLAAARRAHRQKRRSCNLPSPRRNSAASQNRRRAGAGDSAVVLRRSLPGPPSLFLPVASPVSMRRQRGSTRPDAAFPSAAAIAGYDSGLPLEFKRNQLQMKATTARRPQFAPPPRRRSPPCGARPPGGKSSSPHIHAGRRQRQEGGGGMKSLWTEGRALAADRIRISAPQVFSCDLHSPPHPAAEPPKGGTGKPPGCSREDEATGPPPPPAVSVFPHAAASPSPRRSACPAVLSSSPRPSRPVQPSPVKPPERQPEEPPINCSSLSPTAVQRVLKAIRQQKQKKEEEEEQEEARAVTPPKRSSVSPANVTPTPSKLTATHPGSPEGPPSLLRGLCLEDSENPLPGTDNCKFLHGMDDDFVAPLPQRAKRHIRQRETHNFGGATAPCQRPVQPRPPPFSPGPAPRYPRFRGRHSVPSSPPQEVKQRRQEMKPHCRDSESPPPTFFARTLARALARSRREAAREKNTLRSSDKRSHPPPLRSGRYRSITPPPPVVQHKRTAAPPKIAVPAYWRWSKRPDLFGNEDRQKGVGGEKSKDTPLERNQTFGDRDSTARRSVGREGRRKVQSGSSGLPSCEPPRRLGRGREASVCVSVREVEENDDAQRQEDTQKEEVEGDSNAGPPVGIGCSSSISAISVSSRAPLLNILNKVCPAALRGEGVAEGESIMGFLGEAGAGTAETRGVDLIALCQNLQSQLDLLKKTFASSSSEKKGESTTNTPIREPMQTSATPGDQPDIKKPEAETPQAVAVTEKNRTDSPPTPVPQRIHHPVDVLRLPPPSQPPVVQRNSFSAQQTPDDEETISNENAASSVRRGPPEWATGFRSSPQPSSVTGLSGALMGMGAGSALSPSLPFPGSPSSDISRLFAFLRPGRGTTGSTPVPPPNLPRPPPSAAFTRHTRSEAANFLRPSTMHCERLSIVSAVPGNPRQTQSEMGGLRQERSADTARFPGPSSVRSGSARAQSVESAAVFVSADAQLQGRESAFGDRCDFPLRSSYPASVGLNFSQASSVSGGRGRGTEDLEGEGGSVKGGGRVSVDGGKQKAPSGRDEKEEKADGDEGERASVTSAVPSIATEDLRSPVPLSPDLRPSVCSQKERESRSPSMTPHASPKWPTHRSPTARLDSEEREQIDRPTFPTVVPQPPYASPLPWWPPPPGHAEANLPTISLQAPPQPTPPSMTPQSPSLNFTFGRTPLFSADTCAGRYGMKARLSAGTSYEQTPSALTVEGSADSGSSWTTLGSYTGETSWTSGSLKQFSTSTVASAFNWFRFTGHQTSQTGGGHMAYGDIELYADIGGGHLNDMTWTLDSSTVYGGRSSFYKAYAGSNCAGLYRVYSNTDWWDSHVPSSVHWPTAAFDRVLVPTSAPWATKADVPVAGAASAGDFHLILEVPCNVTMSGYHWQSRPLTPDGTDWSYQNPDTLSVYAAVAVDAGPASASWTLLHSFTGESGWTASETRYYSSNTPSAGPFNYFKFQIGRIQGTATTPGGYVGALVASAGDIAVYASTAAQLPDTDECLLRTHNCDANAACTNTVGTFTCACNQGFSGTSGTSCTADASDTADDRDECSLGTHACPSSSTCVDTPGAYTCNFPSTLTADSLESSAASGTDEGTAANVKTMEALESYATDAASDSKADGAGRVNTIADITGKIVTSAAASGRKLSTKESKAVTAVLLTAADTLTTLFQSSSDSTDTSNEGGTSAEESQTAETTAVSEAVSTLANALQSAVSQSTAPSRSRTGKATVNSQLPLLRSLESSLATASSSAGVSPGSSGGEDEKALSQRRGSLQNATKEVIKTATSSFAPLVLEQAGSGGSSTLSTDAFSVSASSIGTPISVANSRAISANVGDLAVSISNLPEEVAERVRALDGACSDSSKAVLGLAAVSWSGNIHSYAGGNREMGSSQSVRLIWCGEDVGARVFGDAQVRIGISGLGNGESTGGRRRRLSEGEGEEGCASFDEENAGWSSLCEPVGGGGCECAGAGGGLLDTESLWFDRRQPVSSPSLLEKLYLSNRPVLAKAWENRQRPPWLSVEFLAEEAEKLAEEGVSPSVGRYQQKFSCDCAYPLTQGGGAEEEEGGGGSGGVSDELTELVDTDLGGLSFRQTELVSLLLADAQKVLAQGVCGGGKKSPHREAIVVSPECCLIEDRNLSDPSKFGQHRKESLNQHRRALWDPRSPPLLPRSLWPSLQARWKRDLVADPFGEGDWEVLGASRFLIRSGIFRRRLETLAERQAGRWVRVRAAVRGWLNRRRINKGNVGKREGEAVGGSREGENGSGRKDEKRKFSLCMRGFFLPWPVQSPEIGSEEWETHINAGEATWGGASRGVWGSGGDRAEVTTGGVFTWEPVWVRVVVEDLPSFLRVATPPGEDFRLSLPSAIPPPLFERIKMPGGLLLPKRFIVTARLLFAPSSSSSIMASSPSLSEGGQNGRRDKREREERRLQVTLRRWHVARQFGALRGRWGGRRKVEEEKDVHSKDPEEMSSPNYSEESQSVGCSADGVESPPECRWLEESPPVSTLRLFVRCPDAPSGFVGIDLRGRDSEGNGREGVEPQGQRQNNASQIEAHEPNAGFVPVADAKEPLEEISSEMYSELGRELQERGGRKGENEAGEQSKREDVLKKNGVVGKGESSDQEVRHAAPETLSSSVEGALLHIGNLCLQWRSRHSDFVRSLPEWKEIGEQVEEDMRRVQFLGWSSAYLHFRLLTLPMKTGVLGRSSEAVPGVSRWVQTLSRWTGTLTWVFLLCLFFGVLNNATPEFSPDMGPLEVLLAIVSSFSEETFLTVFFIFALQIPVELLIDALVVPRTPEIRALRNISAIATRGRRLTVEHANVLWTSSIPTNSSSRCMSFRRCRRKSPGSVCALFSLLPASMQMEVGIERAVAWRRKQIEHTEWGSAAKADFLMEDVCTASKQWILPEVFRAFWLRRQASRRLYGVCFCAFWSSVYLFYLVCFALVYPIKTSDAIQMGNSALGLFIVNCIARPLLLAAGMGISLAFILAIMQRPDFRI
uniref:EGF-like domain-containing protein n=1 Tax=Chromera velia CCMP2878 TaxID=1169474 RepID=A0A0G4FWW3_9ALVE|eukprot:Cvel_3835.t1-p1 / transcript=Cvel_3835.t1 / gene=Cvel_3835 / organism=Chromera_velia_CCMP2878 / gene_product=Fibrillin-2, putative / transcript_product=Fibrillin-2, putative / location=Cvel_scaffold162:42550-60901(-) / protein_length=3126 / sequence_SO=supercontig / SO=protein_coding / is_pseudo=false